MPATLPVPRSRNRAGIRLGALDLGVSRIYDPDRTVAPAQPGKGNLQPAYPSEAERRHEEGTVLLRIHIDAEGHATAVDVIESSGYPLLDGAARARLLTWHFQPARRQDGSAAPDIIEIGFNFQLH